MTGVIETAATVFDEGEEVGKVKVGQTVTILGMNDETKEVLISFKNADGKEVSGLVPETALVATGKSEPSTTPAPTPEASPSPGD
jgi:hypothetical protein